MLGVSGRGKEGGTERMDKFIDVPLFLFKLLKIIKIKMYGAPKSAQPTSTHVCATSVIASLLGLHPRNQQMRPLPRNSLQPAGYELFATAGNE
jgi:hypothetical protein